MAARQGEEWVAVFCKINNIYSVCGNIIKVFTLSLIVLQPQKRT
jgi:hypothetical protein